MADGKRCSIITVSYNSAKTIEQTIKSVLNQTTKDLEYIIVDGASKDNTVEIIKKYEDAFEGRLRWVSEPDDGLYYAMNKGIEMATGELIGIINSDDWYEEDAVQKMLEAYDKYKASNPEDPYAVFYGKLRTWRDGKEVAVSQSNHETLKDGMIAHPTCFVTTPTYEAFGAFNTKYISAADYDMMLRFYEYRAVHFEALDSVIANFTLGGICASGKAYYDLLKVRYDHELISSMAYALEYIKCKLYDKTKGRRK